MIHIDRLDQLSKTFVTEVELPLSTSELAELVRTYREFLEFREVVKMSALGNPVPLGKFLERMGLTTQQIRAKGHT